MAAATAVKKAPAARTPAKAVPPPAAAGDAPQQSSRRRGFTPLTPMRVQAAKSMAKLADQMQQSHPDMLAHQHVRDAARMLRAGNEEAAQRHLRAAAFSLSPQSLMRHGLHTDDAHVAARQAVHGVHRHILLVKDIADTDAKNQAAIRRDSYGDDSTSNPPPKPADPNAGYGPGALAQKPAARQPPGQQALNAPNRSSSGGSDPNAADPDGPQPRGSKQFTTDGVRVVTGLAYDWGDLASFLEFSVKTAALEVTPAPYGKPGGPGLYGVAGQKHSDYFEQLVKAFMEKRGMDKAGASRMAWGALKRWARGGGHVHPEVQAAAAKALAEEEAKAKTAHAHAVSRGDVRSVLALTGDSQHRHIPGSPYEYEHGYKPLTEAAAKSHFGGKVPKGWSAPSGGRAKDGAEEVKPQHQYAHPESGQHETAVRQAVRTEDYDAAIGHLKQMDALERQAGVGKDEGMRPAITKTAGHMKLLKQAKAAEYRGLPKEREQQAGRIAATATQVITERSPYTKTTPDQAQRVKASLGSAAESLRAGDDAGALRHLADAKEAARGPGGTSVLTGGADGRSAGARITKHEQDVQSLADRARGLARYAPQPKVQAIQGHAASWDDVVRVLEFAFNPAQPRVAAGSAGGGQFAAAGAQPAAAQGKQAPAKQAPKQTAAQKAAAAAAAKAHAAHVAHVAHVAHEQGVSTKKAELLVTAQDDKQKAAGLIKQRNVLEKELQSASGKTNSGQAGSTTSANATTSSSAPSTTASTASTTSSTGSTTASSAPSTSTASTSSASTSASGNTAAIKAKIGQLNDQINQLLAAAKQAETQAATMK